MVSKRLKQTAREYLLAERHEPAPAELPGLLRRTRDHVRGREVCAEAAAGRAAIEAWSEMAAEKSRCYVDLEASTPQLLVLVDETTKTRRYFPAVDLVKILGPRIAA